MTGARRSDALVAAAETLDGLAIDQGYVIDPFAAIEQLGLTLGITKLDNLLGAVVPHGTGGVLITSERSPAIQRYTAAHEIGHWILHETRLQLDDETEVLGRPSNEMEREAQLFAGYFLMPPALLDKAASAYKLKAGDVTPEQVYRLGRDLHVSYEAAARRLRTARFLDDSQLRETLAFGRMRAMQSASYGYRPAHGLADMWDASSDQEAVSLIVEEHDEVLVGLPEQRLSGWRWLTAEQLIDRGNRRAISRPLPGASSQVVRSTHRVLPSAHDAQAASTDVAPSSQAAPPAALVADSFVADHAETAVQLRRRRLSRARTETHTSLQADAARPSVGGAGTRTLIVRTAAPGLWDLRLFYAHAYDPRQEPILSYALQLIIQPTPNTAFRDRRLASDLDQLLPGDPDDDTEFEVT